MLEIKVASIELFDEGNNKFTTTKAQTVQLEHSLLSLAKWEAIWEKPFWPSSTSNGLSGYAEELSYVHCMLMRPVPEYIPGVLLMKHGSEIKEYITRKRTATTIHRLDKKPVRPTTITSEIIYYWMVQYGIPFECERWHLNRLMTLIEVCQVKTSEHNKTNKMSPSESALYRAKMNKKRRGL